MEFQFQKEGKVEKNLHACTFVPCTFCVNTLAIQQHEITQLLIASYITCTHQAGSSTFNNSGMELQYSST